MSRTIPPLSRLLPWLAWALVAVLVPVGAASAAGGDDPPGWCLRPNRQGDFPTCTWDGTGWHRSFDGGGSAGGAPAGFAVLFVLVLLGGVGVTVEEYDTRRAAILESL